ncbi:cytochrome c [Opitutus sp. GAS368]|uniref:c-type cytochrome n=1 Tax=Opitutus sp. GAS368 TaxID=1882749 RepID=UPI000879A8FA|nr:cytochrome c [Opitutus sp. GAS368]SDS43569.1 Cytochrome c553 [Opitutus sp. GAS368]
MTTHQRLLLLTFAGAALTAYGADAGTNWTESCAKCHGADGKGDTKMGRKLSIADLTDPKTQAKFTNEEAFKSIKSGRTDENGKTTMKAVEGLTDEDINSLVAHVRTLKK